VHLLLHAAVTQGGVLCQHLQHLLLLLVVVLVVVGA
jgi:hypothetical protein